jgi:hypothetical protein
MKENVPISALRETKWELTLATSTSDLITTCDYLFNARSGNKQKVNRVR